MGVWNFYEDGTATGGNGKTRGTWTIRNKEVRIEWTPKYWATFHRPIDKNGTTGDSWDGVNLIRASRTSDKPPKISH